MTVPSQRPRRADASSRDRARRQLPRRPSGPCTLVRVRRLPPLLVALLACALAGALPAPAIAAPQQEFVGVVSDETFEDLGSARHTNVPAEMAALGIGTVRQNFDWNFLARGKARGRLNYVWLDRFIGGMARHNIRVMPILFNPPRSLTRRPKRKAKRGAYPPKKLDAIGRYGALLARRYGSRGSFWRANPGIPAKTIVFYQVWNEPNLPVYWQPKPNARQYAAMLRHSRRLIRRVDRRARIVTAGIPASKIRGSIPQGRFISQMYRAKAKSGFDILALNPYAKSPGGVLARVRSVRRVMNRNRDRRAGIWATEFGWADSGSPRGKKRRGFDVGPSRQAANIRRVIPLLWRYRRSLRLQGIVYYAMRDQRVYRGGKRFWGLHTGLKRRNGSHKPAFTAFEEAVASLR
jgi:polysaccharide biosynthesis protein PslG